MTAKRFAVLSFLASGAAFSAGCAVPQPKGAGQVIHRVEPQTRAGYYLYLPEEYVQKNGKRADGRRWPLVVTFHGMRPWDDAGPQIREWQQEADRYGFVVIAPELRTCDSFMQYPLKDPTLSYVQRDEGATLAIMDQVFRETNADPSRVLATSWSSGGYLAHYMVNRHPERFHCLAVRQSNFSESMLSTAQISRYRDMKVGIFFGENDFKACREESIRAVEWYRQYRFPVQAKYVSGLGHERTPQTAAAFFATTIGVPPRTPPDLGHMVMYDIQPDMSGLPGAERKTDRRPPAPEPPLASAAPSRDGAGVLFNEGLAPEPALVPRTPVRIPPPDTGTRTPSPVRIPPAQQKPTPRRPIRQPYTTGEPPAPRSDDRPRPSAAPIREQIEAPSIPARLHIEGDTVGPAPLMLNMRIELPDELRDDVRVSWTDNDRPLTEGFDLERLLPEPGEHAITVRVTTADDRTLTLTERVRVLPPTATQPS